MATIAWRAEANCTSAWLVAARVVSVIAIACDSATTLRASSIRFVKAVSAVLSAQGLHVGRLGLRVKLGNAQFERAKLAVAVANA